MAGIAEENDALAAPAVVALAVADGHDGDLGRGLDHAADIGMELAERGDEGLARQGSDGSVALPRCGRDAAHQVDLVAPCRHEVGEQVAVGAPPLRAVAHGGTVQARDREDRTMSDAPGEAWRLRAEQALTHLRRYAVGADDDVDLVPRAVGEDEPRAFALCDRGP